MGEGQGEASGWGEERTPYSGMGSSRRAEKERADLPLFPVPGRGMRP